MTPFSVDILLALALASEIVCVVGIFCSATVYDRLHFSGATSAVAPLLVMAAMVVEQGYYDPAWNAIFDAVALLVLNAALTHATARVARQRELRDVEL
jgi:multisubunit Na+/H+ antiporter MnhG subunit